MNDRRRPEKTPEEFGQDEAWLIVRLDDALGESGHVSATVLAPVYVSDSDLSDPGHTFEDEWRLTSRVIPKVWHGFTPERTFDSGTRCAIRFYFGKWIIVQAEC